jgi:hypothetical protein
MNEEEVIVTPEVTEVEGEEVATEEVVAEETEEAAE